MKLLPLLMEDYKSTLEYAKRNGLEWFLDNYGQYDYSKTRKHLFPMLLMIKKNKYTMDTFRDSERFPDNFYWYSSNEGIKFKKDTYQFKTLDEFNNFVAEQRYKVSKKDKKKVTSSQMEKVFENDKALVIRIKGKMASCIYGYGTKWCITQKNERYYEQYVLKGYIFYFVLSKVLKPTDLLYKAAVAIDVNRHWHVFNAIDAEVNNEDGSIDKFMDEHNIPYDVFKYLKTSYMDRLTTAGVVEIAGNTLIITDSSSIDFNKLDTSGYNIKFKDCLFEINARFDMSKLSSMKFENCRFYLSNIDINNIPAGYFDIFSNKAGNTSAALHIEYCKNVNVSDSTLNELTITGCENAIINNINIEALQITEESSISGTNITVTKSFSFSATGTINGLHLNGINYLLINGKHGDDRIDITNVTISNNTIDTVKFFSISIPENIINEIHSCKYMIFNTCYARTPLKLNPKVTVDLLEIIRGVIPSIESLPTVTGKLIINGVSIDNYDWLKTVTGVKAIKLVPTNKLSTLILRKDVEIQYMNDQKYNDIFIEDGVTTTDTPIALYLHDEIDVISKLNVLSNIKELHLNFSHQKTKLTTPLTVNTIGSLYMSNIEIDLSNILKINQINDIYIWECKQIPVLKSLTNIHKIEIQDCSIDDAVVSDYISTVDVFVLRYSSIKSFGKFTCSSTEIINTSLSDEITNDNIFNYTGDRANIYISAIRDPKGSITMTRFLQILNGDDEIKQNEHKNKITINNISKLYDPYNDPTRFKIPNDGGDV